MLHQNSIYLFFSNLIKLTYMFIIILTGVSCSFLPQKNDPVTIHGRLKVDQNKIIDKHHQPVSLAGNSFFWSNPSWKGVKFYNKQVVKHLQSEWNTQIIRIPLSADGKIDDSYLYEPEKNLSAVEKVIQAGIDNGLYVIIDWHAHDAHLHEKQAIEFFQNMAKKYGRYPNIIYEIYNEPLNVSWDSVVKPYAENVIKAIRKIDNDNLIVVGTPNWAQDVDIAAKNPITGFNNIAYSLHFYASSHTDWLINKMKTAIDAGLPLFVTEWGTVKANGDGTVDEQSVKEWMSYLKKYKISHCNWCINDKEENASALKPGVSTNGNWNDEDLTQSGKIAKYYIKNWQKIIKE